MKIIITDTENEFFLRSAQAIADIIEEKPAAKIGLSTGRTTKNIHKELVNICCSRGLDCKGLRIFGIDEITNMPRSCKASCWDILLQDVIKPLSIPLEHFIMPDGNAQDLAAECRSFEEKVEEEGGPDFIFLGLGENGHLAFNQPGTPFGSHAALSWMDDSLRERLLREYDDIPKDARMGGITLGIVNIMRCPRLVIAANGPSKAEVVKKMITGPVTESLPASILQLHPNITVILDRDAASLL